MGFVGRGHPTTANHALARFADPVPNLSQFVGDGVLNVPGGRKIYCTFAK